MSNHPALMTPSQEGEIQRLAPKQPATKKKRSIDLIGVLLLFVLGSGLYFFIQVLNVLMYNAFSPNPLFTKCLWCGLFPIVIILFLRLLHKKSNKNASIKVGTWKNKAIAILGMVLLAWLICLLISSIIQYFASIYADQVIVYQGTIESFTCHDSGYRSPNNTGVSIKLNNGQELEASYLWSFCDTQRDYDIQTFLIGKPVVVATRHNFLGWTVDEIFYNNKSITSLTQLDLS